MFSPKPPEPSVIVEGNPDNPFGVKLRKTSVLHRFSSEEESAEVRTRLTEGLLPFDYNTAKKEKNNQVLKGSNTALKHLAGQ